MMVIKPCYVCGNYPGFCECDRPAKVYAPCVSTFIRSDGCKIVNVSEGPQGEDIATYECPQCSGTHDSRVIR